jgi:HlyD family secretion protein
MLVAWIAALAVIEVDRVVTAAGRVVSKSSVMVVQPLETAIVRSIVVHEGQRVRSGDMLARLDPTFSAADVGALKIQTTSLEAEVSRLQAEVDDRQFQTAASIRHNCCRPQSIPNADRNWHQSRNPITKRSRD